jgi:hypothetical protein
MVAFMHLQVGEVVVLGFDPEEGQRVDNEMDVWAIAYNMIGLVAGVAMHVQH